MANQRRNFFALIIYFLVAFNCIHAVKTVKNLQQFISTETLEAEDYSYISGTYQLWDDCPDHSLWYEASLGATTVIEYRQVNFLYGMNSVIFRVSNNGASTVDVALHFGNSTNQPFVTFPVDFTGDSRCDFVTLNVYIDSVLLTGVEDLYLTFPSAAEATLNLDWLVFNRTDDQFNATEKIQAERLSLSGNDETYDDCADTSIIYVGHLYNYSVLGYDNVDFGSGVQMVTMRVSNAYEGAPQDILLHLGNSNNTPIATIPVGQTGTGNCDFLTLNAFLDTKPVGVQDLFLTFPSSPGFYLHLDWFVFNQTVTHTNKLND